jgi:hypothetical protein
VAVVAVSCFVAACDRDGGWGGRFLAVLVVAVLTVVAGPGDAAGGCRLRATT